VKHGECNTNFPELSLLKFLLLTYHHSHFLATTLDFTSFFTMTFLGAAHFFYSWPWAVFGLDGHFFFNHWTKSKLVYLQLLLFHILLNTVPCFTTFFTYKVELPNFTVIFNVKCMVIALYSKQIVPNLYINF